MAFTLSIATDNDAFQPDPAVEVIRLLQQVIERLSDGRSIGFLVDVNGNSAGEYVLESD